MRMTLAHPLSSTWAFEQMDAGAEGYDPLTLFKPYLTGGTGSMEALQKFMMNLMTSSYGSSNNKKD